MENNSELLQAALDYAKKGIAVFPLKERDKSPITVNGFKEATTDEAQIVTWWTRHPNANIGIATGQLNGGLCVIDVDKDESTGKNGYNSMKDHEERYGKMLGKSPMSITGRGGMHYFFRAHEEVKCRINILPAVDIRGDGGYIMAPPSIHPNGNTVKWRQNFSLDDVEVAEMDDNIRFLLYKEDKQLTRLSYVAPSKIPEGERNGMLFKFASMMQAKGASDEAIYAATMAENNSKCAPPLRDSEIQNIVKSVLKYDKGKPIYVTGENTAIQGQREPQFRTSDKGKILKTWDNICEAIEFDEELYGSIKYNSLANAVWVYGLLPWEKQDTYRAWRNSDDVNLKKYLEKRYGFNSTEKIMDALISVADKNRFNPVVDELEKIHVDYGNCKGAIATLLPEYLGVEETLYNTEVLTIYMLGAISRVYYPGCKFDYSIILYGNQGFGKSEFLRHLAINPEWFNDNFNTFEGDKAIEKLSSMWILEMAELKALKSSKDAETFKAFLTSRTDYYRAPYSRRAEQRPRMCVFAGTTNNKNIFIDKTGNRRFLPIITRMGYQTKDLFGDQELVMEDFKKAWGEAMEIFIKADKHPKLILSKEAQVIAEQMQEEFSEDDYRVGMIKSWLEDNNVSRVCVLQLIEQALHQEIQRFTDKQRRELAEIMDNEMPGWKRYSANKGRARCGKYGRQLCWIKEIND